jgi:hypothetical protein
MLQALRANKPAQLVIALIIGIVFGFLLQKGGGTDYNVILGQLLFTDFAVLKIMLSAVIVGMVGVHFLNSLGIVKLHPKAGSVGQTVVGSLIFGLGFAILGYCPGTVAGAVGQGSLDALCGGVVGILIGAMIFAAVYGKLKDGFLKKGDFGDLTLPKLLKVNPWVVVVPVAIGLVGLLYWIESAGFGMP